MQSAERTAEHAQRVHSTDIAAITTLQAKAVELELCISEQDHKICETRALVGKLKGEVCSLLVYAKGREMELRELKERVNGYEREVGVVRGLIVGKEDEVEKTREMGGDGNGEESVVEKG